MRMSRRSALQSRSANRNGITYGQGALPFRKQPVEQHALNNNTKN